jgi:hypothetical protein
MAKRWKASDRPEGSSFIEEDHCSARVRPTRDGFEWSLWIGPSGRRVIDKQGTTATQKAAKKAAERALTKRPACRVR